VSEHNDGRIVRLDEQTGKVVRDAVVGQPGTSGPAEIIPVDQDMLIVDPEGQAIVRADAETGTVKQQYHFDHWPCEQAGFAAGSVWLCLVDPTTEALSFGRFDPATGTLGPRYAVPVGPGSALLTAHTVWVGERDRLISFDPATGVPDRALRIDLEGADARYLLKVAGSIWVACADGRLLRFDPADFL
jgi:streptogramin lyase